MAGCASFLVLFYVVVLFLFVLPFPVALFPPVYAYNNHVYASSKAWQQIILLLIAPTVLKYNFFRLLLSSFGGGGELTNPR